jgi:hypothetical protein
VDDFTLKSQATVLIPVIDTFPDGTIGLTADFRA